MIQDLTVLVLFGLGFAAAVVAPHVPGRAVWFGLLVALMLAYSFVVGDRRRR